MSVPARGTTDPAGLDATEVQVLTRRALRLSQFTVAYNVAEGVVAVTAGLLAGLVSLVGFGLDSGIESATAVLVALRLSARLRLGESDEAKERPWQLLALAVCGPHGHAAVVSVLHVLCDHLLRYPAGCACGDLWDKARRGPTTRGPARRGRWCPAEPRPGRGPSAP